MISNIHAPGRSYDTLTAAARNPVTGKIALGTTGGMLFLYDLDRKGIDGRSMAELRGHPVNAITWSPSGIFVASAHQQGYVGVWHAASGRNVLLGQIDKKDCPTLSWSRGGAFLVIPCAGRQEMVVYPESEFTLEHYIESGQVIQMSDIEPIFKWKGGKGNLTLGNFSPDDLLFAFTGGNPTIHVADTTEWKVKHEVKVPVRPTFVHWVANDRLLVAGPLEKGARAGENRLLRVDFPSGKVLIQLPCPTINLFRLSEQEGLAFMLQEVGDDKQLGFRVIDVTSLQAVGEISPKVPDICDVVLLPQRKKVCIVTRTSLILGDWNGKEGSNYEQVFAL